MSFEGEMLIELTPYEKLVLDTTILGDFNVISSTYFELDQSKSLNELNEVIIRKSLAFLQKRHPFLRSATYVDQNDKSKAFLKILKESEDDLNKKIEFEWLAFDDSTNIIECMEMFNSEMFNINDDSLLWRCQLISYNDDRDNDSKKYVLNLSLALHICDGICISNLSLELINILNSLLSNTVCEEMKIVLKPSINLHELADQNGFFNNAQKETVERLSQRTDYVEFILDDKFKSNNETGLKIDLIRLDQKLTNDLLSKCKQNKARITGCLNTAAFYALRKLYISNGLEAPSEFCCDLPANLRLRQKPNTSNVVGIHDLRLQVCMPRVETSRNNFGDYKDFWSDVIYVHKLVEECTSVETGTIFSLSHDMDYLREFDAEFNKGSNSKDSCIRLNRKNKCDLLLSNIGTHVFNRKKLVDGPIQVKQTYFGDSLISDPNILPALMFHVCFWNGEIMIQLSSNKSSIGSSYVNQLVEYFIDTLKQNV